MTLANGESASGLGATGDSTEQRERSKSAGKEAELKKKAAVLCLFFIPF